MTSACIETYSGHLFDLLDPQPNQFEIEDIAHALSNICRYTGHSVWFYSVAQHSFLGSFIVPEDFALEFLCHDMSEAFLGDLSRPLKHLTAAGEAYRKIEENVMRVIRLKYGLPTVQSPIIHEVDNMMLYAEREQLMRPVIWTEEMRKGCEALDETPANVIIEPMLPVRAKELFLSRFYELSAKRELKEIYALNPGTTEVKV